MIVGVFNLKKLWILSFLLLTGVAAWYCLIKLKSAQTVSGMKIGTAVTESITPPNTVNESNQKRQKLDPVAEKVKPSTNSPKTSDPFDYGKTPRVKADANPQIKSVVESVKGGQHPEQLSVMLSPKSFDMNAYKADKLKYLNTVEPGRVFMPAQPGPDVQRIKAVSSEFVHIKQDGNALLQVQALPELPVTFTSFDCGKFENELTSITVAADAKGIAAARFFGAPGTAADVNILCACPATSGQVRFTVNIQN